MNSISTQKFNKKYTVLESQLLQFLYWREQNVSISSRSLANPSMISTATSTLDQEVILMKKIASLTPEGEFNQNSLNLHKINLFELFKELCLPKKIFPEKSPFLKYWLIPFVSLGALIPQNAASHQGSHSNLITTSPASSQWTEDRNLYSNINSLYQVIFEDKELKQQYKHLLGNEQNELSTLSHYYYQKLDKQLTKKTTKSLFPISIKNDNSFSTKLLDRQSYQSAKILWKWLTFQNHTTSFNVNKNRRQNLKTLNQECNLPKNQQFEFQAIPSKIDPSIFQKLLEDSKFNQFQLIDSKKSTPIESYKHAQILLDRLATNMLGSTDLFSSNQIIVNESIKNPNSKLCTIIDKLFENISNPKLSFLSETQQVTSEKNETLKNEFFYNKIKSSTNSFLNIYLDNTKIFEKLKQLPNFSSEILQYKILKKFYNQKDFYEKLIAINDSKNLINLRSKNFKIKKLLINDQIQNQVYTHFYLNQCVHLLTQIQKTKPLLVLDKSTKQNAISNEAFDQKNTKIHRLTYELFLLKNLKNGITSVIDSKNEYSSKLSKMTRIDVQNQIFKENLAKSKNLDKNIRQISGVLAVKNHSNSILKLQVPFKSTNLLLTNEFRENKKQMQKQETFKKESSSSFIKQNPISNQHPLFIVSSAKNLKTKKSSFIQLGNQLNRQATLEKFWVPILQPNFPIFLNEIVSRFRYFQNSILFTEIPKNIKILKSNALEKNHKELLWNSEIFDNFLLSSWPLAEASAERPSNSKYQIQKKPLQFSKREIRSIPDRRKMEKVLKNYLSSKTSLPNSLINVKVHENRELLRKKKSFFNLLKKVKIRIQIAEPTNQKPIFKNPVETISIKKHKIKSQQTQLNPNSLLKRIGFLFIQKIDRSLNVEMQKNQSNIFENSLMSQIEELKAQQKKQRRKKQNLETRRRKKRKRWYPRPNWLRFQMYQDFLQLRHFPNQHLIFNNSLKKISKNSTHRLLAEAIAERPLALAKSAESLFLKLTPQNSNAYFPNRLDHSEFQIYRKNRQKWGQRGYDPLKFQKLSLTRSLPILTNQDFYKISTKTMNEFQRLCWKSSWLRSNLNPYINRIQQNLKKMKASQQIVETNSTFQFFFGSFFGFKKSDMVQMNSWPFGGNTESKFNNKMNDLSLDWYLNCNTSFEPKVVMPSFSLFQNQENIENYNSILMKRISSIIKNVKMNLNTNGQPQAHSFIQGRRKLEKQKDTSQMTEFFYNLTSTSFPLLSLNPFSSDSINFSPINYVVDNLLIPSNHISRLRILWGLNRTHGLTFKENTDIQKIWQSGKIRDQNKSNKTKKFLSKSINQLFPKNMTKLSFEKTKLVGKKLSWHRTNDHFAKRIFDIHQPKLHLTTSRDLKFYLKGQSIPTFSNSHLTQNLNFSILPRFQTEKAQQNALHFWWSTKNPFESFFPLSVRGINSLTAYLQTSTSWSSFVIVNSLWLGALLFHLSILFSLFRIGEIRSLLKFYFLIISKTSQGYFFILKMTWEVFEVYSSRVESIFSNVQKQAFKVQSSDLTLKHQTKGNSIWLLSSNAKQNFKQTRFNALNSFAVKGNIQNSLVEQVWARFPFVLLSVIQTPLGLRSKFPLSRDSMNPILSSVKLPITSLKSVKMSSKPLLFDELASFIQFPILLSAKSIFFLMDSSLTIFYQVLYKIIDFFESCIMVIYHFLEKPAELMIEWVAQVFLIEWSSDILSFFPDLFDSQIWNAFSKFSRGSRIPPIFGFLLQRRLFFMTETLFETLAKPDIDLLERQKKGILFWDIWGEILIQAAENYQMNLVSFMTLKDEQDLFMEKLLEDSKWEWSYQSMIKMSPLLNFIGKETQFSRLPSHFLTNGLTFNSTSTNFFQNKISNVNRLFKSKKSFGVLTSPNSSARQHLDYSDPKDFSNHSLAEATSAEGHWKRWSVNQSFTYQGRDTDLFVDLHPPKSFHHLSFLKSTPIAQQTLGPLVCQIYSGLFTNEIAKNILLVGSPGIAKTLFIQALAGEAELKLMTDHAQRYAGVQQGIAVGMKFLKDVFDAIALYSPCIFLLEDIHLIGEKRSMLISDQENNINNEEIFGVHQEEVHEKNQLFYHWTRHHLTHYQRPYKSDFSVGIPTNQFCFDLFFGIQPPKSRPFTPKSPLPISNIELQVLHQNVNPFEQSIESVEKIFQNQQRTSRVSYLQIPSEKTLSPPATSPFLIFALKEKQHLKPRKRVKQIPWGGFSSDQMNLLPKMAYSVRIKVALLADLAIRNLSVKLDMITDLLVILDNVRSNRGFVVFATTHMPSLLDPALRRPGRFDETISLPIYPNLLNRWEILKTNFSGFSSTCDFLDYALVTSHFNETMLLQLISETKLSLLNLPDLFPSNQSLPKPSFNDLFVSNRLVPTTSKPRPIASLNQAFQAIIEKSILLPKNQPSSLTKPLNSSFANSEKSLDVVYSKSNLERGNEHSARSASANGRSVLAGQPNRKVHSYLKLHPVVLISLTYFQIGTFFVRQNLLKNQNSYHYATWTQLHQLEKPEEFLFKQFYSPSYELKNQVTQFFSGKIAQSLIMHSSTSVRSLPTKGSKAYLTSSLFPHSTVSQKFSAIGGFELFWNSATAFVSALIYKRFLYQTNIVTSNLLDFDNFSLLLKPLSPPASTISMPAKKYENFQRIQRDFHQKSHLSIHDKLEMHQKQRLMKNLYKKPLEAVFRSESLGGRCNTFTNSFQELGYLDSIMLKPTSVNAYYQSRMLTRHKFSFIHQWWNGQLAEHNVESTFLSDVDWRSMFVRSIGDLVIDFPDAEQYYNPRQRRWFFNSSSWGYWSHFNQTLSHEISYHFMLHCYQNASNHLQQHRESLDYYAHTLLQQGMLKEMDFITVPSRFRIH